MNDKKLILAVALSGLVVVVFGVVVPLVTGKFGDKDDEKQVATEQSGSGQKAQKPPEQIEDDFEDQAAFTADDEDLDEPQTVSSTEPIVLKSDILTATINPRGGVVRSWQLDKPRYVKERDDDTLVPIDIVTRGPSGQLLTHLALRAAWKGGALPADLEFDVVEKTETTAKLSARTRSWEIERTYELLEKDYQIKTVTKLTNLTHKSITVNPKMTVRLFREAGKSSGLLGFLKPVREKVEGQCMLDGDIERKDLKKIIDKGDLDRLGHVDWMAVDDLYFIAALIPDWDTMTEQSSGGEERQVRCALGTDGKGGIKGTLDYGRYTVDPDETITLPTRAFLGPKEYDTLDAVGMGFGKAIDYGWFSSLSRFLYVVLVTFDSWVGNWALAIIMLTIAIKLVLSPLTHWSFKSMGKMQAIKPLIDDLNRQYPEPEDRDKKSQALMALYKTHKINPLMGCLPMLLQMPIWIALYRMLSSSVELYRTPLFLWITDLSQADPYFVLPVILGASMFLQQKLTPTTVDNQQAKMMMYMMPIMFTVFMLWLPAGLNLYILVNTLLTIAQQRLLYRPKVVTTEKASVQLMSEMGPGEIKDKRKGRKSDGGSSKKKGKGRRKK